MSKNVLDPKNLQNGFYDGYGHCIVKFRKTNEWRKATIRKHTWVYLRYEIEFEPDSNSKHFPEGGVHTLSLDNRWNDADIVEVRLVPADKWDWEVPHPVFTEYETLVNNLKERLHKGEKLVDTSRAKDASDWRKVQVGNDSKYGNVMYSPSLDVMRKQTFDEFYGGGIVD